MATTVVLCIVALATAFHLATRRPGHDWGGDFAQYVRHAANLVEGAPYGETSEVFHPAGRVRPVVYPPALPVLLAPVYAARGADLEAMKALLIVVLALSALAVYAVALRRLGTPGGAIAVTALFVFNPFVWAYKDQVLSEIPFLLFVYLALMLADDGGQAGARAGPARSIALGVVVYLAFATRTVGVALAAALVIDELWRARRARGAFAGPTRGLLVAVGVAGALALVQSLTIRGGGGYLADLRFVPLAMLENVLSYVKNWSDFWTNGFSEILRAVLFVGTFLLAVRGYFARARRAPGLAEAFVPAYLAIGLLWPYDLRTRFLLPLFPLYLMYLLEALRLPMRGIPPRFGATMRTGVLAGLAALSYAGWYATANYSAMDDGPLTPDARATWQYLRAETAPDAIVVFRKPRVLALFAERRSARPPDAASPAFEAFLGEVDADYLLVRLEADEALRAYARVRPHRFRPLFANASLELYGIDER